MNTFTVEETNLLSIYNTGGKRELVENLPAHCHTWERAYGRFQSVSCGRWTP